MEEEKTLTVVAPEGYEIDKEKSTIEKIVFKKKSYEDVAKNLLSNTTFYYINSLGGINKSNESEGDECCDVNRALTKEQLEWILALNKLRNTALVLNDGWKPDWSESETKYVLSYNHLYERIEASYTRRFQDAAVYFKNEKLARKAIEILGEETIKTALGVYLVD